MDVPLRLLIADDHEIVRVGVRTLLKDKHEWEICGDAENGREAIAKVWDLSPDVVILDLSMPVMNGFEAATEIRRIAPSIKIILYSVHDVPATASEVGADAFVSKSTSAQELIATIERVTGKPQGIRTRAKSA
jgi:two-component system, NarL family, nitrate/nitrite response regulator NarL